jgi:type I restriction-modification system DNA methylase subunit
MYTLLLVIRTFFFKVEESKQKRNQGDIFLNILLKIEKIMKTKVNKMSFCFLSAYNHVQVNKTSLHICIQKEILQMIANFSN